MEAAATMTTESLTQRSCLALRVLLDNSGRRVQETYRCCCRKVACMQASGVWRDGDHLLADRPLDSLGLRPLHFEDANVEAQATSEWSISYLKGQLQLVQCHASELLRVICTTLILAKDDQHRSAVLSKLTTIIQPLLQVLQEANATLSASLKLQTVLQHRLDDDYPEEVTAVVRQCRMSSDQQRLSASAAGYYEQAVEQLVDVEVHCQAMMARLHYMSSTLLRDVLRVQRGTGDITLPKSAIKHWANSSDCLQAPSIKLPPLLRRSVCLSSSSSMQCIQRLLTQALLMTQMIKHLLSTAMRLLQTNLLLSAGNVLSQLRPLSIKPRHRLSWNRSASLARPRSWNNGRWRKQSERGNGHCARR
eukprot:TRINITY_DN10992_c0_g1_i1.p1 TRINITY_DN10992_c0_g1~~TRINITY_DN10992_c0_g1_i1.p1  ORF type:complete len:363 (+),score=70.83 TRINITY_DN10992_c0_g1_i1:685-1773(+)